MSWFLLQFVAFHGLIALTQAYDAVLDCSDGAIPRPVVFGINITRLATATSLPNFGLAPDGNTCYVTVTSTHDGTNDEVNTYIALPSKGWNARFQGIGGGGWVAGDPLVLGTSAAAGYSTATTDAGHEITFEATQNASSWALSSPGNVNQQLLYDFARRSLRDMTLIGKAVTESFYGRPVFKSYWNGCSTGGRQGYAIAQYYPDLYDGILANAPAIQWTTLVTFGAYLWSILTSVNYFPSACEFQAVVDAVIAACDELDGVKDNIIQAPALCKFDAGSLVGKNYTCYTDNTQRTFPPQIEPIVSKIWKGAETPQGQFLSYGLIAGANFSALFVDPNTGFAADTIQPFGISDSWVKGFLAKDYSFNTSNISLDSYSDLFLQAHLEYDSIIGTASPDLRRFKQRGGKLITWQGLADELVPPQQTILYYQGVHTLDHDLHDFYRLFFSPGVGHCTGGIGVTPDNQLAQLQAWVENGTAPDTLKAASPYKVGDTASSVVNTTMSLRSLDLCPYPQVNQYDGKGDPNSATSYSCNCTKSWLSFPGPRGKDYNFYTAPGWYGGDSSYTFI